MFIAGSAFLMNEITNASILWGFYIENKLLVIVNLLLLLFIVSIIIRIRRRKKERKRIRIKRLSGLLQTYSEPILSFWKSLIRT